MHVTTPLQSSSASSFDWIDRVAARFDGGRQEAFRALRAVLTTLRDALPVDIAVTLSTRIPLLLRGVFFENYEPTQAPMQLPDARAFLGEVDRRLQTAAPAQVAPPIDPAVAVDAVIAVVADHLDTVTAGSIQRSVPVSILPRSAAV